VILFRYLHNDDDDGDDSSCCDNNAEVGVVHWRFARDRVGYEMLL
jgi:hypothetical protein